MDERSAKLTLIKLLNNVEKVLVFPLWRFSD